MRTSPSRHLARWALLSGAVAGLPATLLSAPIGSLYSTGIGTNGVALAAQQPDPHYRILLVPDPTDATLEGIVTNLVPSTLKPGFPVGPWLAESAASRWIAPQADQSTGSDPGDYLYETTFDLTGLDPSTARIIGKWTSDNGGKDIILNGTPLGLSQGGGFGGFYDFEIATGFVPGTNVLQFLINNAPPNINPTGFRMEVVRATAEAPGDPPAFLTQPAGALVLVGDAASMTVEVDGSRPMSFAWRLNGQPIGGATEATYAIASATLAQAGDYAVVASNAYGARTSNVVRLRVLEPVPGVFATGVGADAIALDDYLVDPHFKLVTNPNGTTQDALVHDSTVFPIVAGPWFANSDRSKWIGPDGDTIAAATGDYVYRATFTLPADFDPATAVLFGRWGSDNEGLDILVNGVGTGNRNTAQFASLTPFEIAQGIVAGANTVEFKINNASLGYTALRLDPLRLGALRGTGCKLRIAAQPNGSTVFAGATVTLAVVADGCPPVTYQWQRDGQDLPGRTTASFELPGITSASGGSYTVVVRDSTGVTLASEPAVVAVLDPIPGLFNTGVDATSKAAEDGSVDLHYQLATNPHDPASKDAIVEDSTLWPIVAGPWLAVTETSKWIGPLAANAGAPGEYTYRTTFVVPADFDPASVRVEGFWTSDNNAPDIVVNGNSTGISITGDFTILTKFTLTSGFRSGTNTLDFLVANAGTEPNPTGLRIEGIRADGRRGVATPPSLAIARTPTGASVSWPVSATGFKLYSTPSLGTPAWTEVNAPVTIEGDRNVVAITPAAAATFHRLQK